MDLPFFSTFATALATIFLFMLLMPPTILSTKEWLYFVGRGGPNNQFTGFKEAVALARVLGRGIILPEFQNHALAEHGFSRYQQTYTFGELFRRDVLSRLLDVTTMEELQATGDNATVSQLVCLLWMTDRGVCHHHFQSNRYTNLLVDSNFPHFNPLDCTVGAISLLQRHMAGHRIVAVSTWMTLSGIGSLQYITHPPDRCAKEYMAASRYLRRQDKYVRVAQRFIQQQFQGMPFVAVHVRPYQDDCFRVWENGYNHVRAQALCNNPQLHDALVPSIQQTFTGNVLSSAVFVMAHSRMLPEVGWLLGSERIQFKWLFPKYQIDLPDNLMISLVEQEICSRAAVFLFEPFSSISYMVIPEVISNNNSVRPVW